MKTPVVLVAVLLLSAGLLMFLKDGTEDEQHHLRTRWTHDNSHLRDMTQDHIHPWMNNAWYRYVHDRTKGEPNNTACYICSHMPCTSTHPTFYGNYMNKTQAKCAASFAGIGYQHKKIIINETSSIIYSLNLFSIFQGPPQYEVITVEDAGLDNGTCDQLFWINFNVTNRNTSIHFPVFLDQTPGKNHSMCYRQDNGNRPLGNTTNCNQTAANGEGAPVNTSAPNNGTYWVQGMAWLCGQRAYFILPPGWTGTCAPIFISDHTFRMSAVNSSQTTRRRRDVSAVQPHDPIYGSDVPEEFKLWTTGQKVLHSLFPWVGTGKNMLRIETLDYRFGLFLNASCKINNQQNEEIDALRITVMQHRVALDMILAEKGGLCILFNNTCCTYIPDNVHSSNMTDALRTLKQLRDAQQQDYVTNTEDWLTWLLSGSWKSLLMKGLVFVGVLLLLLCCFTSCILPCVQSMINKVVAVHVQAYLTLPMDEDDDDPPDTEML
ncbi:unnamed protein product [Oreochromis niloticus]|nr:unnamed protein product [Mustela putorius furo]